MRYDSIAIPDSEVPQAIAPTYSLESSAAKRGSKEIGLCPGTQVSNRPSHIRMLNKIPPPKSARNCARKSVKLV